MSAWGDIKTKIYDSLGAIAVVDGYNYDWGTEKRLDIYIKTSANVTATVHYPEDEPIAEEILEESTNEYRVISRNIEIKCRVISTATVINSKDVVDQNNDALDSALEDLYTVFNSNTLNTCDLGVKDVIFVTASKESITSKSVYYPFLLNAEFQIIYKQVRN
jgi:hypothetical protein